jgi:quercetin dioxygenase-like cupin family protein
LVGTTGTRQLRLSNQAEIRCPDEPPHAAGSKICDAFMRIPRIANRRAFSGSAALILVASLAPANRAGAQDAAGYPAAALLSTGQSIVGETIRYPTSGAAHVTASIIVLAPGAKTIVHKHGVPLFAYILEGELTVDYGTHGTRTYVRGQAFMEAMSVAHFGANSGTAPVRILAVYMGAQGTEDVVPEK